MFHSGNGWPLGLIALLGLTNGHLASVVLMWAPQRLPPAVRPRSGAVMAFSVTFGITIGSVSVLPAVARHSCCLGMPSHCTGLAQQLYRASSACMVGIHA